MSEGELKRRIRSRVYECLDDGGLTLEEMEKRDRAGESDLHGDPVVNYTDLEAIIDEAAKDFPVFPKTTHPEIYSIDCMAYRSLVAIWFEKWFGGQP